jgi:plastocyanin
MLLAVLAASGATRAGTLAVRVEEGGKPVADAVVMLRPASGQALPADPHPVHHFVDQRSLVFVPYLQVARPGDDVVFRNSDSTRHHVYSFSPVRAFEFVLAPAQASPPLQLEKAGAIAVGCNIHDQMIAYLYVTDAPRVAQTGATGAADFDGLPAGDYDVQVWQPRLRPGRPPPAQRVSVPANGPAKPLAVALRLLPDPRLQAGREHAHY